MIRLITCLIIVAATLSACQETVKEVKVATPLPEIPQQHLEVGYQLVGIQDGEEVTITLVSQNEKTRSWESSTGCTWTELRTGFSPSTTWNGCSSVDGSQHVELSDGNPYPIKLGNSWSYYMSGSNISGGMWSGTRSCTVESTAKITVAGQNYDTYKVVCTEPWGERIYYMSPELKTSVRRIRHHQSRGTTKWEIKEIRTASK